jgi:hypothetical protein
MVVFHVEFLYLVVFHVKDDKIEELSTDIKDIKNANAELINLNKQQSAALAKLMGHTINIEKTTNRIEAYAKDTYQTMHAFMELFIQTGTSNSLFKNILENHEAARGRPIENRWYPMLSRMTYQMIYLDCVQCYILAIRCLRVV